MTETLISYLHYLSFMVLFAALVAQHLLFATQLAPQAIQRLARLDGIYGLAAIIVLVTGLLKVFAVGKPVAFYMQNGFFHVKFTLFILAAAVSIWPTLQFLGAARRARQAGDGEMIQLPRAIVMCQRVELLAVVIIPLLAALMVRYG